MTTVMFNAGRGRYAPLTVLPMLFVVASTMTASYQMVTGRFADLVVTGMNTRNTTMMVQGCLNIFFTGFMVVSVLLILTEAVLRWIRPAAR